MAAMSDPRPLPPPFGVPQGPTLPTAELLGAYVSGATTGSSPEAHIEGTVLMGSDHLLAVRVGEAFLVRGDDVPAVATAVHGALCRALEAAGATLMAGESVLAGAVAGELAVPRGFEWTVWARDPDTARAELIRRATSDLPNLGEAGASSWRIDADFDAVRREIESDL